MCAAATAASRAGAFPSPDEPLDAPGLAGAGRYRLRGPAPDLVLSSASRAAIETARAIGRDPRIEPLVADLDCGDWAGRTLAEVHEADREAFERWIADPAGAIPGGETMRDVADRVGRAIDRLAGGTLRSVVIVTHAAPIRAALAHALGLPIEAAMRIDVAPLGTVCLSRNRQWRLQELRLPKTDRSAPVHI